HPDTAVLDRALDTSLARTTPRTDPGKSQGKSGRYPIGTVAVLDAGMHRAFCLAYAAMGNDLVARATVDDIWRSLSSLWETVYIHARLEPVSMAIIGSELASRRARPREPSSTDRLVASSPVPNRGRHALAHDRHPPQRRRQGRHARPEVQPPPASDAFAAVTETCLPPPKTRCIQSNFEASAPIAAPGCDCWSHPGAPDGGLPLAGRGTVSAPRARTRT
ncbi:DUF6430 domain-containing protein, partial [Saccharothrix sp. MB29]|nr:DUF6430 domain-containing protein [Saccharothrix sp. MB29]